ncbi:Reverse transcriptase domain-containing protein [Aphis craccivora]|uniref:Reverse transcriptase domain-containing protein n=1 Tax=Aphis craccivora TaxID=307492 RepID=A0A6G0ZP97_APHCR|nr:Reverse transcriptase domain-containing protein [Aphis craccivora]
MKFGHPEHYTLNNINLINSTGSTLPDIMFGDDNLKFIGDSFILSAPEIVVIFIGVHNCYLYSIWMNKNDKPYRFLLSILTLSFNLNVDIQYTCLILNINFSYHKSSEVTLCLGHLYLTIDPGFLTNQFCGITEQLFESKNAYYEIFKYKPTGPDLGRILFDFKLLFNARVSEIKNKTLAIFGMIIRNCSDIRDLLALK